MVDRRPDQAAITQLLQTTFDVSVLTADFADESLKILDSHQIDLVLINRKLDSDHSDGLNILSTIKSRPTHQSIPVILVTNYAEWQEKAVGLGAAPGFGKAALYTEETADRIRQALQISTENAST